MRLFILVVLFVWLLCGVGGAFMLDDHSWKTIARGPITLVRGFNESPVTYPGPS